jgi:quercetin dioxygenase-like cupin family protein
MGLMSFIGFPTQSEIIRMKLIYVSLIAVGALAAGTGTVGANAEESKSAARVERNIMERHDQSGVPGKEIVIGTASFPAGSSIGFHTHPGDESGYVMKGSILLKTQGQPDRVLKAGDSFFNARGAVHSVVALPTGEGGVAVSSWIVDKGQPLATPVP